MILFLCYVALSWPPCPIPLCRCLILQIEVGSPLYTIDTNDSLVATPAPEKKKEEAPQSPAATSVPAAHVRTMSVCVCVCVYIYICVYICVYVYLYACLCLCLCLCTTLNIAMHRWMNVLAWGADMFYPVHVNNIYMYHFSCTIVISSNVDNVSNTHRCLFRAPTREYHSSNSWVRGRCWRPKQQQPPPPPPPPLLHLRDTNCRLSHPCTTTMTRLPLVALCSQKLRWRLLRLEERRYSVKGDDAET